MYSILCKRGKVEVTSRPLKFCCYQRVQLITTADGGIPNYSEEVPPHTHNSAFLHTYVKLHKARSWQAARPQVRWHVNHVAQDGTQWVRQRTFRLHFVNRMAQPLNDSNQRFCIQIFSLAFLFQTKSLYFPLEQTNVRRSTADSVNLWRVKMLKTRGVDEMARQWRSETR